ncbi:hypothetical protein EJ05DRAFT_189165 [Pseudovirgaria hyperparasitica]|uniref:Uncharacterized protein n=1 Tax=Pseudovirgaria hyperparasitica TaxID=470096 RepID=A0A6A6WIJ6_9PEZI|nr:uncharacterized protein EJ05DRAFT_189165 [Pseudovirgaria hyperparasitica]KAF2761914.1 hypothetical protein EJ05DRAFT_189165 [Pseudovirgaria hyperparasitica]
MWSIELLLLQRVMSHKILNSRTPCDAVSYSAHAFILFAGAGIVSAFRSLVSGSESLALTSRKWYRTIMTMAALPRKTASEYSEVSDIIANMRCEAFAATLDRSSISRGA